MIDVQQALLTLQGIPGIGSRTLNRMLTWAKETGSPIADVFGLSERDLRTLFKLRPESIAALQQGRPAHSQQLLSLLAEAGFSLCVRGEDRYPNQLGTRLGENAPPLLAVPQG